jgi:hypothetical protein
VESSGTKSKKSPQLTEPLSIDDRHEATQGKRPHELKKFYVMKCEILSQLHNENPQCSQLCHCIKIRHRPRPSHQLSRETTIHHRRGRPECSGSTGKRIKKSTAKMNKQPMKILCWKYLSWNCKIILGCHRSFL